jgi:isoleucyl-tRNA synthetase
MNPTPQKSQNAEQEEKILQFWRDNNVFQKTLEKKLEPGADQGEYTFFEGPPTANGRPGIHHVAARSFKDIIPRYKTMRGFRVNRKAGWDTHGLPVELQVEKQLGLKSKKEIENYGVELFNQKCRESVWEYKDEWEKITERMGYWLDMEHPYVTYDNGYIEALWATVKRANERGHLYKDFKILPWCTRCGTALSSHELNQPGAYKEVKDLSVFAKFPIVGFEKAYFLAWTTTPWTLPGNVALAVGADIDYVEAKVGDEILVLAKVHRDAVMSELSSQFLPYRWNKNKGYGTKDHCEAIKRFGPTPHHRKLFIRNVLSAIRRKNQ